MKDADGELPMKKSKKNLNSTPKHTLVGSYQRYVELTIHSKQAALLMTGKKPDPDSQYESQRQGVYSVIAFKNSLYALTRASQQDKPYADLWLLDIEQKINILLKNVKNKQQQLHQKLSRLACTVAPSVSSQPKTFRLDLGYQPYANQALEIIQRFDALYCCADACSSFACISKKEFKIIYSAYFNLIKQLFDFAISRQALLSEIDHITRLTYNDNSESIQNIKQELGELPNSILNKTQLPSCIDSGTLDNDDLDVLADIYEVFQSERKLTSTQKPKS